MPDNQWPMNLLLTTGTTNTTMKFAVGATSLATHWAASGTHTTWVARVYFYSF